MAPACMPGGGGWGELAQHCTLPDCGGAIGDAPFDRALGGVGKLWWEGPVMRDLLCSSRRPLSRRPAEAGA